jgi:hypothetical protein
MGGGLYPGDVVDEGEPRIPGSRVNEFREVVNESGEVIHAVQDGDAGGAQPQIGTPGTDAQPTIRVSS